MESGQLKSKPKRQNSWCVEELSFLKENYGRMVASKISSHLGRSLGAIHLKAFELDLSSGIRGTGHWTYEEICILKTFWPTSEPSLMVEKINRSYNSIRNKASELGVVKCEKYLSTMRPRLANKNHRNAKIGAISYGRASKGFPYIKVAMPDTWELLSVHVWRKHYGSLPDLGMAICPLDGNFLNVEVANLVAVPRYEITKAFGVGFEGDLRECNFISYQLADLINKKGNV